GFYALRISQRLAWIQSIISPGAPIVLPTPSPTPNPSPSPSPNPSPAAPVSATVQMLTPAPGSTLSSLNVTFSWSAGKATAYKLLVGTSPGVWDIYNSGRLSVHSVTVGNIPTDGSTICVRLSSR